MIVTCVYVHVNPDHVDQFIQATIQNHRESVKEAGNVLLIPLAATSPHAMMRRLGRRWQMLHRLMIDRVDFTHA